MTTSTHNLNPAEAARRLGISAKTLRIYEARGLISPIRTAAGWRVYSPDDMTRAAEVATLRRLGLSLAQVARVLEGNAADLDAALAAHTATLQRQACELSVTIAQLNELRTKLATGKAAVTGDVLRLLEADHTPSLVFDLPWPWGGERYALSDIRPIMYITGPLGSGKTRFAQSLADVLPGADFLGMERFDNGTAKMPAASTMDPAFTERVDAAGLWIKDEGGQPSDALRTLLVALETERDGSLVIDMIEHGLDAVTQTAVMAYQRHRSRQAQPLFVMTRSTAILDLSLIKADEGIIYCPANHSPPLRVAPFEGAIGYEAVATCLAPPDVRARTAGVIAWRPQAV